MLSDSKTIYRVKQPFCMPYVLKFTVHLFKVRNAEQSLTTQLKLKKSMCQESWNLQGCFSDLGRSRWP